MREELKKYLHKKVEIILSDGSKYAGSLRPTEDDGIYFVEAGDQCRFPVSLVAELKPLELINSLLIHPGETLFEVLRDRGISKKEFLAKIDFTEEYVSNILNGAEDITPEFAAELEKALDIPSSFWLNLQSNYNGEWREKEKE